MGAGNLAHTGIRSPDRPARSGPLYRLSYPGPTSRHLVSQILYGNNVRTFGKVLLNDAVGCSDYTAVVTDERVWNIGGTILTEETEALGDKLGPVPLCTPQIPHRMV